MLAANRNARAIDDRAVLQRIEALRACHMHGGPGVVPRDLCSYALVAGLTPGLSLKNCLFNSMKLFH